MEQDAMDITQLRDHILNLVVSDSPSPGQWERGTLLTQESRQSSASPAKVRSNARSGNAFQHAIPATPTIPAIPAIDGAADERLPSSFPSATSGCFSGVEEQLACLSVPSSQESSSGVRAEGADMSSRGSKGDGTQPFSQNFYDFVGDSAMGAPSNLSQARTGTERTYGTEETGHIDLGVMTAKTSMQRSITGGEDVAAPEEVADEAGEDLGAVTQVQIQTEQFPEENRFRVPRTPATQGKKRDHDGHFIAPHSTPRLPVNPFAVGTPPNPGIMSLSQVFKATQAPSSPLPALPTSDLVSDKPSPNLWNQQRPSTAQPVSSPAQVPKKQDPHRSFAEPQANYVSVEESQEDRRRRAQTTPTSSLGARLDESSDDDIGPVKLGVSVCEEVRQRQRMHSITGKTGPKLPLNASSTLARDTCARRAEPSLGAHGIRERHVPRTSSPLLQRHDSRPEIMSDDSQADDDGIPDISSDETEHEANEEGLPIEIAADELGEENKENVGELTVQVPRTSARVCHSRGSQEVISSPLIRRSAEKNSFGANDEGHTVCEDVAIQNSQPVGVPRAPSRNPVLTTSTIDQVVPQSQIPLPTQRLSTRVATQASQQTATPPISSPTAPKSSPPNASSQPIARRRRQKAPLIPEDDLSEDELDADGPQKLQTPTSSGGQKAGVAVSPTKLPTSSNSHKATTIPNTSSLEHSKGTAATQIATKSDASGQPANLPETDQSAAAGSAYATARSNVFTSNVHSSPLRTSPQTSRSSAPPQSLSRKSPRRPRKFTEIAGGPSPAKSMDVDLDFDLLTREDRAFQAKVDSAVGSSPVSLAQKRRRGLLRPRAAILETFHHSEAPSSGPATRRSNPFDESQDHREEGRPTPLSSADQNANQPTFTEGAATGDLDVQTSEKENKPLRRTRATAAPATEDALEADKTPMIELEGPSSSTSAPVSRRSIKSQRHLLQLSRLKTVTRPTPEINRMDSPDGSPTVVAATTAGLEPVIAPNRVLAHFNGQPSGFYTATCLGNGVEDKQKMRVRFDDGTIDEIPSASIRRLELRPGDQVKLDNTKLRGNYTVLAACVKADGNCTDIFGNTQVRLTLKQRKSSIDNSEEIVALDTIYLTLNMFNALKDRDYAYSQPLAESAAPGTPSRAGTPSTPSSRQRRGKAIKVLDDVLQTPNTASGIFANMAFALTFHTDGDKRALEAQISARGGTILGRSFSSLFTIPTCTERSTMTPDEQAQQQRDRLEPTALASSLSFAALIADRHCRSTKYLQALALNIPCLQTRWVRDCARAARLLDWRPYLLPSGASAFLDGAVKSRTLQQAREPWRLPAMLASRARLLARQRVVIVNSSSPAEFSFIAYALGAAEVAVAADSRHAHDMLLLREGGRPGRLWDLVCAHDPRAVASGASDKRKRRGAAAVDERGDLEVTMVGGTRIVAAGFVVQSLILGKLVAE